MDVLANISGKHIFNGFIQTMHFVEKQHNLTLKALIQTSFRKTGPSTSVIVQNSKRVWYLSFWDEDKDWKNILNGLLLRSHLELNRWHLLWFFPSLILRTNTTSIKPHSIAYHHIWNNLHQIFRLIKSKDIKTFDIWYQSHHMIRLIGVIRIIKSFFSGHITKVTDPDYNREE